MLKFLLGAIFGAIALLVYGVYVGAMHAPTPKDRWIPAVHDVFKGKATIIDFEGTPTLDECRSRGLELVSAYDVLYTVGYVCGRGCFSQSGVFLCAEEVLWYQPGTNAQ